MAKNGRDPEKTVLVLQGGGALGAYQAGAYEALAAAGHVAGVGRRHVDRRHQRARSSPATRPSAASTRLRAVLGAGLEPADRNAVPGR